MPLHGNPENASLHSGVEIATTNKKHDEKKGKKSKLQSQVKQRIKFVHALKKDAQHSHINPGFNNPPIRGGLSQGIHEDSDRPD